MQVLIAALRLLAKVAVTLLVAKVPVVELVQALEPLVPAVTVPHENPLPVSLSVKVVKLPGVVSRTVNVLPLV